MHKLLSFEDWKASQHIKVSKEAIEVLKEYHGVDGNKEVDIMLRALYNKYLEETDFMT